MVQDAFLPPPEGPQDAAEAISEIFDRMNSEEVFWNNFKGIGCNAYGATEDHIAISLCAD